jgi:hypothetical protein
MKCFDPFGKLRIQDEDLTGLHPELVEGYYIKTCLTN